MHVPRSCASSTGTAPHVMMAMCMLKCGRRKHCISHFVQMRHEWTEGEGGGARINNSALQQQRRRIGIGAGERCRMQTQAREARGCEGGGGLGHKTFSKAWTHIWISGRRNVLESNDCPYCYCRLRAPNSLPTIKSAQLRAHSVGNCTKLKRSIGCARGAGFSGVACSSKSLPATQSTGVD
jgi:hypothetical protein